MSIRSLADFNRSSLGGDSDWLTPPPSPPRPHKPGRHGERRAGTFTWPPARTSTWPLARTFSWPRTGRPTHNRPSWRPAPAPHQRSPLDFETKRCSLWRQSRPGFVSVCMTPERQFCYACRRTIRASQRRCGPEHARSRPLQRIAAHFGRRSRPNGLALGRFSVIYATPPCVITRRSPVQGSRAIPEHLCLTRPYVPKARTLRSRPWTGSGQMVIRPGNSRVCSSIASQ